jgi:hypothetical protein
MRARAEEWRRVLVDGASLDYRIVASARNPFRFDANGERRDGGRQRFVGHDHVLVSGRHSCITAAPRRALFRHGEKGEGDLCQNG